ncbi:soluble secreted IL-1 binding protein [Cowpox virus]|uniref:Soluble secreted IL-1 binding protein n=1 Tax=Cowpox virus TaxID=10243 RepID=A0A290GM28_COWPX|nr:soluble secreted IL-1 binding protein [Cowpox virus]ATB55688.1 soluble secreted IL-1 binding protein [Cowpox virus]
MSILPVIFLPIFFILPSFRLLTRLNVSTKGNILHHSWS